MFLSKFGCPLHQTAFQNLGYPSREPVYETPTFASQQHDYLRGESLQAVTQNSSRPAASGQPTPEVRGRPVFLSFYF